MTRTIGLKAASFAAGVAACVAAASLALAPPAMAAGNTGAYNCKGHGGAPLKGGVQAGHHMSLGMESRGSAVGCASGHHYDRWDPYIIWDPGFNPVGHLG
jgi:hypothetical protein